MAPIKRNETPSAESKCQRPTIGQNDAENHIRKCKRKEKRMKNNPYATNSGGLIKNTAKTVKEPKSARDLGGDLRIKGER